MSEERLCEAYGEHQAYCSLYGYPLGKDVAELIAAARAAAVAPLEKALRAVWLTSPVNCIPESLLIEIERLLASAPSPVREPEGLDVERLRSTPKTKGLMEYAVEAAWDGATSWVGDPADGIEMHELAKLADGILDYLATRLAATPERPADEVDG